MQIPQEKNNLPKKITSHQAAFLEVIRTLIERDGIPPTLEEMAVEHGVTKSTARAYVRRLSASGYLMQQKGKFRTVRLAEMPTADQAA